MQVETLRSELDQTPRLNLHGEDLRDVKGAPTRDMEVWRDQLRLAGNTVPGGYCGLPEQESCPHFNRCFTCEDFVTTPKHLPTLLGHLEEAQMLALSHEKQGKRRWAEKDHQTAREIQHLIQVLMTWVQNHPDDLEKMNLTLWLEEHQETLANLKGKNHDG